MFWKDRDYVGEDTPRALAKRRGTDFIDSGLFVQFAGALIMGAVQRIDVLAFWLGATLVLLAVPLLVVGCARRSISKGQRPIYGALGLLSLPGVVLLWFLPDRNRAKAGFDVVMPMKVSTTWLPPDEDPKWMPRSSRTP